MYSVDAVCCCRGVSRCAGSKNAFCAGDTFFSDRQIALVVIGASCRSSMCIRLTRVDVVRPLLAGMFYETDSGMATGETRSKEEVKRVISEWWGTR